MPLSPEETIIVQHLLVEDEGMELLPYFDCCGQFFRKCKCKSQGKLTIGVGRNIEDIGISENEALGLELNDIKRVSTTIERSFEWFRNLNTPRKVVVISMVFNLGLEGFKAFQKMIKCIESGDFASAAKEITNSKWYNQVGNRAIRLASILKTGQF